MVYRFPVASHTYFRIINQASEKERFLRDTTYEPKFEYSYQARQERVEERLRLLPEEARAERASLKLVLAGLRLQSSPDDSILHVFRADNEALFGAPDPGYVIELIGRIKARVTPRNVQLWNDITELLGEIPEPSMPLFPSEETFARYKQYFDTYHHHSFSADASLVEIMERLLSHTGLLEKGWRLDAKSNDSPARVTHARKLVRVGRMYMPRRDDSVMRIAVHEIYGHALRGFQGSLAENEGVAIMLEQLLDDKFKPRRAFRYIAAALGWGTLGRPMTFREVFNVLWRLMVIAGSYPEEKAKEHAFNECARVFRGGNPSVPGAVYLKDTVYFAANLAVWRQLQKQPLSYNEFIDVIEGRRRILS